MKSARKREEDSREEITDNNAPWIEKLRGAYSSENLRWNYDKAD